MRLIRRTAVIIVSLAVLALAAGACGGDSKSTKSATAPAATSAATKAAGSSTAANPAATTGATTAATSAARTDVDELTVSAKEFAFTLNLTSLRPGLPGVDVQFSNDGSTTHTIAFYSDPDFTTKVAESQPVAAGASVGFPFIPPNGVTKLYYRCEIHKTQMKGEIAVQ